MSYLRRYNVDSPLNIDLPFKIRFNFSKVADYWRDLAKNGNEDEVFRAKSLLKKIEKKAPEIVGAFEDITIVEKYEAEFRALLAPLFPSLTTLNDIKAIAAPFTPIIFNATQRLAYILDNSEENSIVMMRQLNEDAAYINACIFVLQFHYGLTINNKQAIYFDIPNKKTGILRHYRTFVNADFSSFTVHDSFQPLSEEEIRELINNIHDIDLWKKKIPPNSFTYEGFAIIKLFDVTEDEAISALKVDLLKKDALQIPEIVDNIRQHLGSAMGISNLKLGFAAYDSDKDSLKTLGYGYWNSLSLSGKIEQANAKAFCHHTKTSVFDEHEPLVFPSYTQEEIEKIPFIPKLLANDINSYILIPLVYDEEVIGVFELGSEKENELNALVVNRLEQIIPLFTTALKRLLDEQETKLETIVQEQFTAIHPSVSWRFFEAAENLLEQRQSNPKATIEEIYFPEVYPLFGQSDVKGSSTERNNAIQDDMIEQLGLAKNVIDLANSKYIFPIYNQLKYKLEECIRRMKKGLNAGDEIEVLEFLNQDIYPVFRYLRTLGEEMNDVVDNYKLALNEELGVVYKRRKDYEQSVQLTNNTIANYLTKAQQKAQEMFPHYFEMYKTDGVEHNLYIGQSIVNQQTFNELHLQNLRLWQLMTICETENLMEFEIKPQLKVSLSVASLILVHHNPITIKFRQEEKRFDVEGAYNIRYEIIKKRIDKATIKGTRERLTQTGKIAIVYSQDREAREYRQYIGYLQSIQYISKNVEWLELNDLQGVTGLRAIRVEVIYNRHVDVPNKEKPEKRVKVKV